jgi:hypothetical protein
MRDGRATTKSADFASLRSYDVTTRTEVLGTLIRFLQCAAEVPQTRLGRRPGTAPIVHLISVQVLPTPARAQCFLTIPCRRSITAVRMALLSIC